MAAEMPTNLRVGAIDYTVHRAAGGTRTEGCVGYTVGHLAEIGVDPSIPSSKQRHTLMHELLHACWHSAGRGWDEKEKVSEEEMVRTLTTPVLMLLRDNPHLVAYLTGTD